jgi:hypothetical protein
MGQEITSLPEKCLPPWFVHMENMTGQGPLVLCFHLYFLFALISLVWNLSSHTSGEFAAKCKTYFPSQQSEPAMVP